MVYCNTYWYSSVVDMSKLSGIDVWIARYGDTINAPSKGNYNYTIWQSMSVSLAVSKTTGS